MSDAQYPIGRFQREDFVTLEHRVEWIQDVAALPDALVAAVAGLSDEQLNTPYREGGWTVAQVVHHLADAFLSHYARFKWALTEDSPTIKPFDEVGWANLADAKSTSVASSLAMVGGITDRWVSLMNTMGDPEWQRTFIHPQSGQMQLDEALGMYAWHGRHHTAQITTLCEKMGWR